MKISGWGQYPVTESTILSPLAPSALESVLNHTGTFDGIARGMGRSYGDSALAAQTIDIRAFDWIHEFDAVRGEVCCAAGITLADLIKVIVPKGWFLPVTPGTKFVTVGGALASDVHGKNHHIDGSFCDHLTSFRLMLANGEIVNCSPTENDELFRATCGGMGLTGVIIDASFRLKKIGSAYLDVKQYKAANLAEAFGLFEQFNQSTYSVAWLDCLSKGKQFGRSLVWIGEHKNDRRFDTAEKAPLSVPMDMPDFLLNHYTMSAFAKAYYNRTQRQYTEKTSHYEPFFYPLDRLHHWNRIYGKRGFIQYQFVISKAAGLEGMQAILQQIVASQRGSFLAVLKAFGKGNSNLLSFPMEGYTLALDFKLDDNLFGLLDNLDRIVLDHEGKIYLTKDARMSEHVFKQAYPDWEQFQTIREAYGADKVFRSQQSVRLGL